MRAMIPQMDSMVNLRKIHCIKREDVIIAIGSDVNSSIRRIEDGISCKVIIIARAIYCNSISRRIEDGISCNFIISAAGAKVNPILTTILDSAIDNFPVSDVIQPNTVVTGLRL
jgi:hypothetical protein